MGDSAVLLSPKFKESLLSRGLGTERGGISIDNDSGSKLLLISSSDGYLLYFCIKSSVTEEVAITTLSPNKKNGINLEKNYFQVEKK